MGSIFYVLKIGVITLGIVLLMQIQVGQGTIENHADQFIRTSNLLEPVRVISEGGFIAIKNAYKKTVQIADSFVTEQFKAENSPGQRKLAEIKRSLAYQKEQERKIDQGSYEDEESEDQE